MLCGWSSFQEGPPLQCARAMHNDINGGFTRTCIIRAKSYWIVSPPVTCSKLSSVTSKLRSTERHKANCFVWYIMLSSPHTHTHMYTHTHAHVRTHAYTHTHTQLCTKHPSPCGCQAVCGSQGQHGHCKLRITSTKGELEERREREREREILDWICVHVLCSKKSYIHKLVYASISEWTYTCTYVYIVWS